MSLSHTLLQHSEDLQSQIIIYLYPFSENTTSHNHESTVNPAVPDHRHVCGPSGHIAGRQEEECVISGGRRHAARDWSIHWPRFSLTHSPKDAYPKPGRPGESQPAAEEGLCAASIVLTQVNDLPTYQLIVL